MTTEEKERRAEARRRPTSIVLGELKRLAPEAWAQVRLVGRWVWVSFTDKPSPETRDVLKRLGFHWNRKRAAWQHPCGHFSGASAGDPRDRYGAAPVDDQLVAALAAAEA